ncbi:MAG: hypothetical protein AAF480_17350 [Actinomycetota bacterium]
MTRRYRLRSSVVALVLVAAACSSDGFDPGLEGGAATETETPVEEATPSAEPTPSPSPTPAVERVQILSGTVTDLGDRRDLTFTVGDIGQGLATGTVPDVVGLVAGSARTRVASAGFAPYLVETFPPTGAMDAVVDMWPSPGLDFAVGANVFLELDGPLDAVPVEVGDELSGLVNGRQILAFDPFENWLVRVWLDDPIAVGPVDGSEALSGGSGEEPLTIGREVELQVPTDDVVCTTGEVVSDPTALPPGSEISFTLAEDPAEAIRFRAPERISAAGVTVDCG